ncbi:hypothetical protein Tco_0810864 [Tanacetum coccineum]
MEPKLYDGNVVKNTSAILIPNSEEILMLAEESRSKMLLKQQDPMMLEKKVNNTLVDYAVLNQLSHDFENHNYSAEISNLNTSLQEKVLVITALKDDLKKLKGKVVVDNVVMKHTIDPKMLKINELLTNISKTCPSINNTDGKLVAVNPKNKDKRVRFTEPVTSSGNIITKIASTSNLVSNKPMLSSKGVKPSTSASGSQPSGNTKKDNIQQTPISTQKNKHSKLNANSELKCVKCNGCMLSDNHDLCVLDFINNVNARVKSKSIKKSSKRKVWKQQRKGDLQITMDISGTLSTGWTFTIVGNAYPITRITTTTEVPLKKSTVLDNEIPKPVVDMVYTRKHMKSKTNVPREPSKTAMASEHSSSGPTLHEMTPATISSGLMPNPPPSTPVDCPAPEVIAPIAEVVAPELVVSTGSPSSTTVDQDAPSPSNSQTTPETQSLIIPNDVEEDNHDLDVAHMNNDPFFGILIPKNDFEASSSSDVIPTVCEHF